MAKSSYPSLRVLLAALLALVLAVPWQSAAANPNDTGTPMDSSTAGIAGETISLSDPEPSSATITSTTTAIPIAHYLTNEGLVTPVKLQNPWGDCWAFAIASAVESAILKKSVAIAAAQVEALEEEAAAGEGPEGTTALADSVGATAQAQPDTPDMSLPVLLNLNSTIDISERAIAWLAHEVQNVESAGNQASEGYYLTDSSSYMNQLVEGSFEMIESQLIARQSLLSEEAVPYQYNGYSGSPQWFDTGTYDGAWDDARTQDWSVDDSIRTNTDIGWVVDEIYKLPSPAITDIDPNTGAATYVGYDPDATLDIKRALLDIGAVAVAIGTDISVPEEVASGDFASAPPSEHFTYSTWSQYNSTNDPTYNHAVTIVGWDDDYSAANFAGTSSGEPPAKGAWLCKNNWGSDALYSSIGASNRATHWGLPADSSTGSMASGSSEETEASGFFWVSYYDHTLRGPVAFGVTPASEDFDNIYQYDYLGAAEFTKPAVYEGDVWIANMFEAKEIELLNAVSAYTFQPGDTVNVVIYTIPAKVKVEGMDAEELFEKASPISHQSVTYEAAGVHTIELNSPLMLEKGEHFIVAEQVRTTETNIDGEPYDGSYLGLELAYLNTLEGVGLSTMSNVVVNPGESFVNLPDGSWMGADEFGDWYIGSQGLSAEESDMAFGNALAKAYTSNTSIAQSGQIYETAILE